MKALVGKLADDGTVEVNPWDHVYETDYARMVLIGLQRRANLYLSTCEYDVRLKRRAKNRIAKKLRKANRRAGVAR